MTASIDPDKAADQEADRGRVARLPREISYKGWWDVIWRVQGQIAADNVSIVVGGLALFGLLAVFPSLAAAVAIYGLIGAPEAIAAQAQNFSQLLPEAGLRILQSQLNDLASQRCDTLSTGAVIGFLLAFWSARRGMVALITAMNVAYNEHERRGFLHRLWLSLLFTICGVCGFVLVVLLGLAVPFVIGLLQLGEAGHQLSTFSSFTTPAAPASNAFSTAALRSGQLSTVPLSVATPFCTETVTCASSTRW